MSNDTSQFPEEFPELSQRLSEALAAKVPADVRAVHEARLRDLAATSQVRLNTGAAPSRARLMVVLAATMVLVMGTSALAFAADEATPGDPLYGLDRAMETVQRTAARTPASLSEVLLRQADERVLEAETSRTNGRVQAVAELGGLALSTDNEAATVASTVSGADGVALVNKVEARREEHVRRLRDVRDKLQSGPASSRAVEALNSVIAKSEAKATGKAKKQKPETGTDDEKADHKNKDKATAEPGDRGGSDRGSNSSDPRGGPSNGNSGDNNSGQSGSGSGARSGNGQGANLGSVNKGNN